MYFGSLWRAKPFFSHSETGRPPAATHRRKFRQDDFPELTTKTIEIEVCYEASAIFPRLPSPQSAIDAMTGRSVLPSSVRLYSVFGGMTPWSCRTISPYACSSRNSLLRMRSLTGGHARRISEKRSGSLRTKAHMMRAFHLPPRMREVKATGQTMVCFTEITLTKRSVLADV